MCAIVALLDNGWPVDGSTERFYYARLLSFIFVRGKWLGEMSSYWYTESLGCNESITDFFLRAPSSSEILSLLLSKSWSTGSFGESILSY